MGNRKLAPSVPWSVPIMALYLWMYWLYLDGKGWPAQTSQLRRKRLRARPLPARIWAWSLLAGSLATASMIGLLWTIVFRLVPSLPRQSLPGFEGIPSITVVCWLAMASLVAGVVEEAAFRGYMQSAIEERHGLAVAILVVGTAFSLGHFTLVFMPYMLLVSAVYGILAYLTGSILPGVVLHAVWDMVQFMVAWRWQSRPRPPIWDSGPDSAFCISCLVVVALATAAFWAYSCLAADVRRPMNGNGFGRY